LTKGVPTLTAPHLLCQKGKTLTSEQAQLLKLTGLKMVTFRVRLLSRWDAASGDVIQIKEKSTTEEVLDEDAEMNE
jgi:mRNA turnover protein 4